MQVNPLNLTQLFEEDVPGAYIDVAKINSYNTVHLKRWLECRCLTRTGNKSDLKER